MDKQLLNALNNLSVALEEIADALNSKKEDSGSATGAALKSGSFIQEIKEINAGVKSIQKDTKQILSNQETLLKIAKSKGENNPIESIGGDKKRQSDLKDGIGSIILIATAVLALGVAFKIIGGVDFGSVIALSIALPLLAIGFSHVHKTLKESGFDAKKDASNFIIAITAISLGITMSSWILSMVTPISFSKMLTVILLGGSFALIMPSIGKMIDSVKDLGIMQLAKSAIFLPIILPAIALGIAFASWALELVRPISLTQFLTTVGITLVFAVVSYGIKNMLGAFKDIDKKELANSVLFLPIILPAIALGIALSSYVLALVKPIGFSQFVTTIFIAATFAVISFAIKPIVTSLGKMNWGDVAKLPVFFVLLSTSIMVVSHILSKTADISFGLLLKILALGATLAIVSALMIPTIYVLGKMNLKDLIQGGLAVVILAGAIMISSHILSFGNYTKYPDWKWALGVGLALLAFTPAVLALGIISMTGVGALAILAGSGMVALVAGTIVATSFILSRGKYGAYPPLSWSTSVALSMTAFTLGMVGLGTLIVSTFGLGALALAAGSAAVLTVANTIVESSYILSKGKYTGGPSKDWAEGVSIAIGAFSPVYKMLMNSSILSLFGVGGVNASDFRNAIIIVTDGIVSAANRFAKSTAVFKKGPSKDWAEGVGSAIGAFAPVYKMLSDNSSWFKSSISPKEMSDAIGVISAGIVDSASYFSKNNAAFNTQIDPNFVKKMGKNVIDYYELSNSLSGFSSSTIANLVGADPIQNVSKGMVKIATSYDILAKSLKNFSNSINSLDGNKIGMFRSLTGNLAMLSALDSNMFSNMMQVLESKSGVFAELLKSQQGEVSNRPTVRTASATISNDRNTQSVDNKEELKKLDRIISILSNIDGSVGGLDEYLAKKGITNNEIGRGDG